MKRLIFSLCLVACMVTSCNLENLPAQLESERYLKATLIAPSTYKKISFTKTADVTRKDEIDERVEHFQYMVELDAKYATGLLSTEQDKERLEKSREELEAVRGLYELYADQLDEVTYHEYQLIYEASNQYGVPIRGTFDTRFSADGYIVGARMGEDSWTVLGNFFSMPEYYDIIGLNNN